MPSSFTPIPTPTREKDNARERRIFDDIIVDSNDDDEAEMGWFYYLLDTLEFPFEAYVKAKKPKDDAAKGILVTVEGMADGNLCSLYNMWVQVQVEDTGLSFNVPVGDILEAKAGAETIQAIADWKYWIRNK